MTKLEVKTFQVHLKDIVVKNRSRQVFTRIMEMSQSIQKFGILHPIVVAPLPDGKYELIAGERRYRGMVMAGISEATATLRDDAPEMLAEIELEENVCRENISFEEEGISLRKILDLKKQTDESWDQTKTAELTGRSTADVSAKIKISKEFEARPDIKEQCKNLPYTIAIKRIEQIKEAEKVKRLMEQGQIQITTDLRHGDCRQLIGAIDSESIDLLLTDPPYGLDRLEVLRTSGSKKLAGHRTMSDTHNMNITSVLEMLTDLAPEINRVMKPGAHFYMFTGFQHAGQFIEALDPHLEFCPPMLIWNRGRPSGPGLGYNYLSHTECIIYGCRPPRGRRLNENTANVLEFGDVPKNLRRYPTEKPLPLLQTLIKNSTMTNHMVLDLFAGSASTLVAARKSGRRAIGFEINEEAFLRSQNRLSKDEDE